MKIAITYEPAETAKAEMIFRYLRGLYPLKEKRTPERDGYLHVYFNSIGKKPKRARPAAPDGMAAGRQTRADRPVFIEK